MDACLALMMKRPQHSKRRIAAELGPLADQLARLLLDCALEDLQDWPGSICLAPANGNDVAWADGLLTTSRGRRYVMAQPGGNLGERIMGIDALLRTQGEQKVIMLGTDCPLLHRDYLNRAATVLNDSDVVLGPARDGGVVLMGSARPWPELAALPWSSAGLAEALSQCCAAVGRRPTSLEPLADVDTVADARDLADELRDDQRVSRVALGQWLNNHQQQLSAAS